MDGVNTKDNLVWLTAREHFIAHVFLAKIHGKSQWYAVMMFKAGKHRVVNSRLYDISKRLHSEWMSETYLGTTLPPDHKAKIAKSLIGNTRTLGRNLSKEHKEKIISSLIGNKRTEGFVHSEITKRQMSASHSGDKHHYFGKSRSDEVKQKISSKLKGMQGPNPGVLRSEEVRAKIRASVLATIARKQLAANPNP
jgi:hypothetical protein